ncbi:peptide-methionine (S)-S-oxide reductase MsrA [Flavobacterium caeni]|uniref:Peptide methionine sulfoxide reductase MsrA n=1 Tax=Flavobacterium caeni TaxID=490189 RepID=A0A1G5IWN1_9FLAO|nr:peptide-methionine (S)-S-oxide reductase MsrA [Flavobacterium caeni]SCY80039.1 peptide-methionine (S)-S-oxide reductase [Flavobacterium caeni]
MTHTTNVEKATFAGGCFWCTEAVFLELDGVQSVQSGYIGGQTESPTYEQVCSGTTGHAEAIEIVFDPQKIDYGTLLRIFFATHDPTTINRQGNDVGTQYRSEIFYHDENQRQTAQAYIERLNQANTYGRRLVTKLTPASVFYVAEDYHQNYYNRNQNAGYCTYVITPKVEKVRRSFAQLTK